MRRAALLGLLLLLPSCSSDIGFSDFLGDTFTVGMTPSTGAATW